MKSIFAPPGAVRNDDDDTTSSSGSQYLPSPYYLAEAAATTSILSCRRQSGVDDASGASTESDAWDTLIFNALKTAWRTSANKHLWGSTL